MNSTHLKARNAVTAVYTPARIPAFKGNPMIEALPPSMNDEALLDALTLSPDFHPEQREWSTEDRFMMLESLLNFMVPMGNHIGLCRALDGMMRSGYVGRAPRTAGHAEISQNIYQMQMAGKTFRQSANSRTPQNSTALIGISGMGKTTTVIRWCAHIPQVIHHPELNLYQVTYLHVEMPSDGSSIKGLAHAILRQLDELLPGSNYYEQYALKGKTGSDTLMRHVARLMNLHLVGLLIGDEVQNLSNAKKGGQTVMTELVSASNELKVPILFIGTNKAQKVLGIDFRQGRRSSGHGIQPWDRLHQGTAAAPGEWEAFLGVLWQFQWTKQPVPLDSLLSHQMYECCQGIIDLAIKLFGSAQARAMLDGSEMLTPELILAVYNEEFKLVHPMLEALRHDNLEMLVEYDDIAPLNEQDYLAHAKRKLKIMSSPQFSVKPGDPTFAPRLSVGLTAMGVDAEAASAVAEEVAKNDSVVNLAQAVKTAVKELSPFKPLKPSPKAKGDVPLPEDHFDARMGDYRRAIVRARAAGTTTLAQLIELKMAPQLEEILDI